MELKPTAWWPAEQQGQDWFDADRNALPTLRLIRRSMLKSKLLANQFEALLSEQERLKMARLRRLDDQQRFLLGRAALRSLIGQILGKKPNSVKLSLGDHGKPALAKNNLDQDQQLHFNLAHSGDLVLLAFHRWHPVGVDVEQHRRALDWQAIAERYFPADCYQELACMAASKQHQAFFQQWCRMEAALKALGLGLAGLETLNQANKSNILPGLQLFDVVLPKNYSGCVALLSCQR